MERSIDLATDKHQTWLYIKDTSTDDTFRLFGDCKQYIYFRRCIMIDDRKKFINFLVSRCTKMPDDTQLDNIEPNTELYYPSKIFGPILIGHIVTMICGWTNVSGIAFSRVDSDIASGYYDIDFCDQSNHQTPTKEQIDAALAELGDEPLPENTIITKPANVITTWLYEDIVREWKKYNGELPV